MLQHLRPAVVLLVLFTVADRPRLSAGDDGHRAARSCRVRPTAASIEKDGVVVGSALIGQNFTERHVFPRRARRRPATPDPNDPTKTIDAPYNAANSTGSNLGPTSQKLVDRVKAIVEALARKGGLTGPVPADAVTTSASGPRPGHLAGRRAARRSPRVAKARGLDEDKVRQLVEASIETRFLGLIGEPRVNILRLNLALDQLKSS